MFLGRIAERWRYPWRVQTGCTNAMFLSNENDLIGGRCFCFCVYYLFIYLFGRGGGVVSACLSSVIETDKWSYLLICIISDLIIVYLYLYISKLIRMHLLILTEYCVCLCSVMKLRFSYKTVFVCLFCSLYLW